MQAVEQYVKLSGHWDLSKVKDMNTNLIREFIRSETRTNFMFYRTHQTASTLFSPTYSPLPLRMVAFKHSLSPWGQGELRAMIRRRVERFADDVEELKELIVIDKEKVRAQGPRGRFNPRPPRSWRRTCRACWSSSSAPPSTPTHRYGVARYEDGT